MLQSCYGLLLCMNTCHRLLPPQFSLLVADESCTLYRFNPEKQHSANAGLHVAQDFLEPVKKQFPWITYADLWTLAGAQAIEEMGGMHLLAQVIPRYLHDRSWLHARTHCSRLAVVMSLVLYVFSRLCIDQAACSCPKGINCLSSVDASP